MKLPDEEIKKAWDICYSTNCCTSECPYFNKHGRNFCTEDKSLYKDVKRILQEHAEQKAEIERLTEAGSEAVRSFTRIETLYKVKCKELEVAEEKARKETVEKFAEMLKELVSDRNCNEDYDWEDVQVDGQIFIECVDEICKEITEGKI